LNAPVAWRERSAVVVSRAIRSSRRSSPGCTCRARKLQLRAWDRTRAYCTLPR
jgi:hypothetical protein